MRPVLIAVEGDDALRMQRIGDRRVSTRADEESECGIHHAAIFLRFLRLLVSPPIDREGLKAEVSLATFSAL